MSKFYVHFFLFTDKCLVGWGAIFYEIKVLPKELLILTFIIIIIIVFLNYLKCANRIFRCIATAVRIIIKFRNIRNYIWKVNSINIIFLDLNAILILLFASCKEGKSYYWCHKYALAFPSISLKSELNSVQGNTRPSLCIWRKRDFYFNTGVRLR